MWVTLYVVAEERERERESSLDQFRRINLKLNKSIYLEQFTYTLHRSHTDINCASTIETRDKIYYITFENKKTGLIIIKRILVLDKPKKRFVLIKSDGYQINF